MEKLKEKTPDIVACSQGGAGGDGKGEPYTAVSFKRSPTPKMRGSGVATAFEHGVFTTKVDALSESSNTPRRFDALRGRQCCCGCCCLLLLLLLRSKCCCCGAGGAGSPAAGAAAAAGCCAAAGAGNKKFGSAWLHGGRAAC
jgi:hypothetical protein